MQVPDLSSRPSSDRSRPLSARQKDFVAPMSNPRLEALALAGDLPGVLLDARRLAASAPGFHGRRRAGQGEAFWQYRDHRPEDGARLVDWRRSARGDRYLCARARARSGADGLVLDRSRARLQLERRRQARQRSSTARACWRWRWRCCWRAAASVSARSVSRPRAGAARGRSPGARSAGAAARRRSAQRAPA